MKRTLAALIAVTLLAAAAAAQTPAPSPTPPKQSELAEAARLTAEVVRLYGLQQYDEALPLARRAVEIRERALGEHLLVASALNNLAAVLMQKRQEGEAGRALERALAIMEKTGSADAELAADINNRLGLLRLDAKDYRKGETFFERAAAVKAKHRGENHPSLVPYLLNLTDARYLSGDRAGAHESLRQAAEILAVKFPEEDLATARKLQSYICILTAEREEALMSKVQFAIHRLEHPEHADRLMEKAQKGKSIVAGGVLNGRAIKKPVPHYPPAARNARVSGVVIVKITVDETGKVVSAEPICGHRLLRDAATEAAAAARFTPTLLSGQPVMVTGVITYTFVIQ